MGILKKYAALEKKYKAALVEIERLTKLCQGSTPRKVDPTDPTPGPTKIKVKRTPLTEELGKWIFPAAIPESVRITFRMNQHEMCNIVKENCNWVTLPSILRRNTSTYRLPS